MALSSGGPKSIDYKSPLPVIHVWWIGIDKRREAVFGIVTNGVGAMLQSINHLFCSTENFFDSGDQAGLRVSLLRDDTTRPKAIASFALVYCLGDFALVNSDAKWAVSKRVKTEAILIAKAELITRNAALMPFCSIRLKVAPLPGCIAARRSGSKQ